MRKIIHKYIRTYHKCQIMNIQKPNYIHLHQEIAQTPQDHFSIDLIGPYNTTTQGNTYTLTAICNLTDYLMTIPIPNKKTMNIAVQLFQLFSEIFLKFSFPQILHSDSRVEFKSKLIENLTQQLRVKKTYISPCHTQSDEKLESSHQFIKDCIRKFLLMKYWNGISYSLMQWLPSIGFLMNTPKNPPHFLYSRHDHTYHIPLLSYSLSWDT